MKLQKLLLFLGLFLIFDLGAFGQEKLKPTVNVNGLIQYDFTFQNYGDSLYSGSEFRKAVLSLGGNIYKNVEYKFQFDFEKGLAGTRDVYIKFKDIPAIGGNLMFGSAVEPTGLDQYTDNKFKTFFEVPLMGSTQGFRWAPGIYYENLSLLQKRMSIQLAYTFNGNKDGGLKVEQFHKSGNFIARVTGTVLQNKEKNQIMHIGAHYENRQRADKVYTNTLWPEVHMGSKLLLKTPNVEAQNDYGFELATDFGPLSIQGEYELSNYNTADKSYTISGYYGFVSYFLTGESRNYEQTNFGMIVPKKNFCLKENGLGAIELAVRYSVMNYAEASKLPTFEGVPISGDQINGLTLGLNWYLNSHTRLTYNYILADMKLENKIKINTLRVQAMF
jgi:phosphate-selective porin OprO/OprP